jgi:DNA repair exonuclease SbcCD ATPase subunit
MKKRLKVSLILVLILASFACYRQVPITSEYDELSKELEELSRQQEELYKQYKEFLESLRQECGELKNLKSYINLSLQKYRTDEIVFLAKLNEKQLELFSQFSESLKGDSLSNFLLSSKSLTKLLYEELKIEFDNLFQEHLTIRQLKQEYNKRITDFEDKKNWLIGVNPSDCTKNS